MRAGWWTVWVSMDFFVVAQSSAANFVKTQKSVWSCVKTTLCSFLRLCFPLCCHQQLTFPNCVVCHETQCFSITGQLDCSGTRNICKVHWICLSCQLSHNTTFHVHSSNFPDCSLIIRENKCKIIGFWISDKCLWMHDCIPCKFSPFFKQVKCPMRTHFKILCASQCPFHSPKSSPLFTTSHEQDSRGREEKCWSSPITTLQPPMNNKVTNNLNHQGDFDPLHSQEDNFEDCSQHSVCLLGEPMQNIDFSFLSQASGSSVILPLIKNHTVLWNHLWVQHCLWDPHQHRNWNNNEKPVWDFGTLFSCCWNWSVDSGSMGICVNLTAKIFQSEKTNAILGAANVPLSMGGCVPQNSKWNCQTQGDWHGKTIHHWCHSLLSSKITKSKTIQFPFSCAMRQKTPNNSSFEKSLHNGAFNLTPVNISWSSLCSMHALRCGNSSGCAWISNSVDFAFVRILICSSNSATTDVCSFVNHLTWWNADSVTTCISWFLQRALILLETKFPATNLSFEHEEQWLRFFHWEKTQKHLQCNDCLLSITCRIECVITLVRQAMPVCDTANLGQCFCKFLFTHWMDETVSRKIAEQLKSHTSHSATVAWDVQAYLSLLLSSLCFVWIILFSFLFFCETVEISFFATLSGTLKQVKHWI